MKLRYLFITFLVSMMYLPLMAQTQDVKPDQITPSDSMIGAELSPDGLHVAILTMDSQGESSIEVWNTKEITEHIRLIPDLTIYDSFVWSPNSQYIAAMGRRGNASGNEYSVQIHDVFDKPYQDAIIPWTSREFGEFVAYEDPEPRSDFAPVWSADGRIIAINRRDGIYFYDITDCSGEECRLLYSLDICYVPWFDWQGDTIITLSENAIQVWDIGDVLEQK